MEFAGALGDQNEENRVDDGEHDDDGFDHGDTLLSVRGRVAGFVAAADDAEDH